MQCLLLFLLRASINHLSSRNFCALIQEFMRDISTPKLFQVTVSSNFVPLLYKGWIFSVYNNSLMANHHVSLMPMPHCWGFVMATFHIWCHFLKSGFVVIMHNIQLATLMFTMACIYVLLQHLRVYCDSSELYWVYLCWTRV